MDLKPIEKLRPFQKFCITIGELPVSYLESLTYLELLYWFINFLQETVIPAVNTNAAAVEELQTLFVQLKDYVDNYFDNLDVQDEIDHKLDEMVEDGTLESILSSYIDNYLQRNFLTCDELKESINISNNMKVRTLGYHNVNDNGGAYYLITDDNSDTNYYYETLQNNLYGKLIITEKIYPEMFGAYGDNTHDDYTAFTNMFSLGKSCYLNEKIYKLSHQITIPENCSLIGVPHSRVLKSNPSKKSVLNFSGNNLHDVILVTGTQVSCTDVNIIADAFSMNETRNAQTIENPRGWFQTFTNFDNVTGFKNVRCYNCTTIGCTIGFDVTYGVLHNCVAEVCDIAFKIRNDSQANLLRAYYCNNALSLSYNNNITNVRGDSIFESFCVINGGGNIISNISFDYVGEYVFELLAGGNSISGIYGDRFGMNHVQYTAAGLEDLVYGQYMPSHYMILFAQINSTHCTSVNNIGKTGGRFTSDNQLSGVNGLIKYKSGSGSRNVEPINFGVIPNAFFYKRSFGTSAQFYTDFAPFDIDDFKFLVSCDNFSSAYAYKNRCPMFLITDIGVVNANKMTLEYDPDDLIVN